MFSSTTGLPVGIYILIPILMLPLFSLPTQLKNSKIISLYSHSKTYKEASRSARLRTILVALEEKSGKARQAQARIMQAEAIVTTLEQKPMGGIQRTCLSVLYLSLFAIPLLISFYITHKVSNDSGLYRAIWSDTFEQNENLANNMSLDQLIVALDRKVLPLVPANNALIQETEKRLNHPLTNELLSLYTVSNGLEGYKILPLEKVDWANNHPFWQVYNHYQLEIYNEKDEENPLPLTSDLSGWLSIGDMGNWDKEEDYVYLWLYQLDESVAEKHRWLGCYIYHEDKTGRCEYNDAIRSQIEWDWAMEKTRAEMKNFSKKEP